LETLVPDKVLDCWGLRCPIPVRRTAETIRTMSPDQVLQVIATDDWFGPDLEAWLKRQTHQLLALRERNGEIHAYLRVAG